MDDKNDPLPLPQKSRLCYCLDLHVIDNDNKVMFFEMVDTGSMGAGQHTNSKKSIEKRLLIYKAILIFQ